MTRDGLHDPLVLVQHHIEDEVHTDHRPGFLDVLAHRVLIIGPGLRPGHELHGVVGLDSPPAARARQDRLDPACVPDKVVVLDVAGANQKVAFDHHPAHLYRRPPGRRPYQDEIPRLCAVQAPDALVDIVAHERPFLGLGVVAVDAHPKHDGDVLSPHARASEPGQQRRKQLLGGARTRDVARHDNHFHARLGEVFEPR